MDTTRERETGGEPVGSLLSRTDEKLRKLLHAYNKNEPSGSWAESRASVHELLVCSEQRAGWVSQKKLHKSGFGTIFYAKSLEERLRRSK